MTLYVGIEFAKTLKGVCKDVKGHVQRRKRAAPAQRRCRARHFFRAGALSYFEGKKRKKGKKEEKGGKRRGKKGKRREKKKEFDFVMNLRINRLLSLIAIYPPLIVVLYFYIHSISM